MRAIKLTDISWGPGTWASYKQGDFSVMSVPEAQRIGRIVADAMRKNEDRAGEEIIHTIALSMEPKPRGVFIVYAGEAFGQDFSGTRVTGTRVYTLVKHHQPLGLWLEIDYVYQSSDTVGALTLMDAQWTKDRDPRPRHMVVIMPTGRYKVLDGKTVTYSFLKYTEDSETGATKLRSKCMPQPRAA